ncbi:hypothetical protein GCM10027278_13390 [Paralcaligenes ginsengisoli]
MHGIAAKIAQEVAVFFKDCDGNPRTRQQQPQHHAGRAASDYAAASITTGLHWIIHKSQCAMPYMPGQYKRHGRDRFNPYT